MFADLRVLVAGKVVKPLSRRHLCEQLLLALAQLDAQECDVEPPGGGPPPRPPRLRAEAIQLSSSPGEGAALHPAREKGRDASEKRGSF